MAQFNGPEATPNVGIRGNPQPLKSSERTVGLAGPTATPNYVSAFSSLAATPTLLGTIGSSILTSASNSLMDKWGYQLGKNPQGDLFPSITEADKRFEQAYNNQSYATLSLEAEKLMSSAQNELSKANKLSPGLINSYSGNMTKGFDDLLKQAPSNIVPKLENELQTNLLRTTTQLNQKLITQQKADYKDKMTLLNTQTNKAIYENAMAGDSKAAEQGLQTQISRNKQLREEGVISATQEASSNQTATQTYWTGIYSEKAIDAKRHGKVEGFLDSLIDKPKEVSFEDWSTITKNVMGNISQLESLERRDQSLISSQFELAVIENKVTDQTLAEIKENLTPENYTKALISYFKATHSKAKNQNEIASLIPRWNDPIAHADATTKTINDAFSQMALAYNDKLNNEGKPPVSDLEAKIAIMRTAGASVPRFNDEIANMIQSGNPDLMSQAANAYNILGYQKLSLNADNERLLASYNGQIAQNRTPLEAAQIAINNNAPKSEDERKAIQSQWEGVVKDHKLNDWNNKVNFAKNLLDIPYFADIPDLASIVQKSTDSFESNYKLMGADYNAAKKLTEDNLKIAYGTTYANGHKQFTYLPIEKFMGVEPGSATGIIQNNIRPQLIQQLEATKKAFDDGNNEFYYRVEDKPSYEEVIAAKEKINEINGKFDFGYNYWERQKEIEPLNNIVSQFTEDKPLTIEKVHRAEKGHKEYVEKFQVSIRANSTLGLGQNINQPISGAYDIRLRSENGHEMPIVGVDNLYNGHAIFRPDINKMQEQYFTLQGSKNLHEDIKKAKEDYLNRHKSVTQRIEDKSFNQPFIF